MKFLCSHPFFYQECGCYALGLILECTYRETQESNKLLSAGCVPELRTQLDKVVNFPTVCILVLSCQNDVSCL